jgi:DNA-binding NtrC family response regulator
MRIVQGFVRGGEHVHIGSTVLQVERQTTSPPRLKEATRFGRLLGASREMRKLYPLCEQLAAVDLSVLIEGETGCGKELLAESLHEHSPRASAPFIVFDCSTVAGGLVESELFGHERGAFTGATTTRLGVFEQASGGTLLIDEIGDLDLALQPKLLRAIERSEIKRVGGDRWIQVNVRLLSATRRDLDREVQEKRFRDDLFHRLAVTRIELPPLRQRRGDVAVLAEAFAAQLGGVRALTTDVLRRWDRYDWPGNVRELRNAVMRYLALGHDPAGELSLSQALADDASGADVIEHVLARKLPLVAARQHVVDYFESRYVAHLLAEYGGNVSRAAAASGIARRHFHRLKAKSRAR